MCFQLNNEYNLHGKKIFQISEQILACASTIMVVHQSIMSCKGCHLGMSQQFKLNVSSTRASGVNLF